MHIFISLHYFYLLLLLSMQKYHCTLTRKIYSFFNLDILILISLELIQHFLFLFLILVIHLFN